MRQNPSTLRRSKWIVVAFVMTFVCLTGVTGYSEDPPTLDEQVAAAVGGGQQFLLNNFTDLGDGTGYFWDAGGNGGNDYTKLAATAAAVAALIESGQYNNLPKDDNNLNVVDKAVAYIKAQKQADGAIYEGYTVTYQNGLALVALSLYHSVNPQDAAFVADYIQPAVDYFLTGQYTGDGTNTGGGWGYSSCSGSCNYDGGDLSNTQFAVMGLWYVYNYVLNLAVPTTVPDSWANRLEGYVRRSQSTTGVFGYGPGSGSFRAAPMTGAGLWALAMLSIDQSDQAVQDALAWFDANYAWTYTSIYGSAYYYGVYAMAKGLAGMIPAEYQFPTAATGNPWVDDLKQAMVDAKTVPQDGVCYWYSGGGLDPGSIIATAFVLMSLGFADPNIEATKKLLADPVDVQPDYPIKEQGPVILETTDGATITDAKRGNIGRARKRDEIKLPIGSFDFKLKRLLKKITKLKLRPPQGAFDPTNPDSFINPDGSIKAGLTWFKIRGGEWLGQAKVPIRLMPPGGPYVYIEVTLTDGGPEDDDGKEDGEITDPGAPGFTGTAVVAPANPGISDGSGGCFIDTIIGR